MPPRAATLSESEQGGLVTSRAKVAAGQRPAEETVERLRSLVEGGGAVFAVGSITFCGSLSHHRYDNNVSRILRNVLDRFRALLPETAEKFELGSSPGV